MPRRAAPLLAVALALTGCDELPVAPPATPPAPFAAPSVAPPLPCPPRPALAPIGFAEARVERRGAHGDADTTGPRFSSPDPDVGLTLAEVQAQVDRWLKVRAAEVDTCEAGCTVHASCQVTRDDGELLALLCESRRTDAGGRDAVEQEAMIFRRRHKAFSRVELQDFARSRERSLLARLLPGLPASTELRVADAAELKGFHVALRADAFEVGPVLPGDPTSREIRPFADVAAHLACDTLLDLPRGPTAPGELGPPALGTVVSDADDPATAAWWGYRSGTERPRFVATDPRLGEAVKELHGAVEGYFAALARVARDEAWPRSQGTCRALTSTEKLVSVLCYGGGNTEDGDTRVAGGSITLRLTNPPQRVSLAGEILRRPGAPAEIARRCLGHLVRPAKDPGDEVLPALPELRAANLGDFAVTRTGVVFDLEVQLGGQPRLMPCHVPHDVLGTSFDDLAAGPKKP